MFAAGLGGEHRSVPTTEEPNQHCCSPNNTRVPILLRAASKKLVNERRVVRRRPGR